MTFLFKVEARFLLSHGGVVLNPGLGAKRDLVKPGDSIRVVRPDKSEFTTTITGIVWKEPHDIMVSEDDKEKIPVGSEIWTI